MKQKEKRLVVVIASAFALSGIYSLDTVVHASQGESKEKVEVVSNHSADQEFLLEDVVVTAQRVKTKDLDTPATTTVITAEQLKDSGAVSIYDALERVQGVNSYSYGTGGEDYGGMYSRINVRGLDKGTLVLVNGNPVNLMNYNSMMNVIPVEAVEKIEVVKGSNSVLYGAEAMGGVINIITKKPGSKLPQNIASVQYGNYDKNYSLGVEGEQFNFYYKREYRGALEQYNRLFTTNSKKITREKGTKDSFFLNYSFNDRLTATYAYAETESWFRQFSYSPVTKNWTKLYKNYLYNDTRQNFGLTYNDEKNNLKSTFAYNSDRFRPGGDATTNTDLSSLNFDTQKAWGFRDGKDTLVGGVNVHRESYTQRYGAHQGSFDRDSYAAYVSYTNQLTDKFSATLGVREHFVIGNDYDQGQNIFLPQIQTIYKINNNTSWYTNIGKSFELPASNSPFYGSGVVSTAIPLKPQEGWNYETGMKFSNDKEMLKVAVFTMDIKNKFKWVRENTVIPGGDPATYIQINEDKFRNTGVELEYSKKINENWKFNFGAYYGDPESKTGASEWKQSEAKLQVNAGTTYKKDKWTVNMDWYVTAQREQAYYNMIGTTAYSDHRVPNRIDCNVTMQYALSPYKTIGFGVYNLLDRENPVDTTEYWSNPRSYRLSYTQKF